MIARWRRLRENAGWSGVLRTVLVVLVVLGFAVGGPLARPELWTLPAGAGLGLIAPWLVRGVLVDRLEASLRVHRAAGLLVLVGLALAREPLKAATPPVQGAALAALAAYISAYFVILSDPQVFTMPKLPPRDLSSPDRPEA